MKIKYYGVNKEQHDLIDYVSNNINSQQIITISGIAGSGKSFTILEMFNRLKSTIKDKSICFSAPTNSVLTRNKKYKMIFEDLFKNVEFLTVSKLLDEKLKYDLNGNQYFSYEQKKINYKSLILLL